VIIRMNPAFLNLRRSYTEANFKELVRLTELGHVGADYLPKDVL